MKNIRGFEVQHFLDDYGLDCSIQESSAVEPHIWLGVHNEWGKTVFSTREEAEKEMKSDG